MSKQQSLKQAIRFLIKVSLPSSIIASDTKILSGLFTPFQWYTPSPQTVPQFAQNSPYGEPFKPSQQSLGKQQGVPAQQGGVNLQPQYQKGYQESQQQQIPQSPIQQKMPQQGVNSA